MEIDYYKPRRLLQKYITVTANMEMVSLEIFVL